MTSSANVRPVERQIDNAGVVLAVRDYGGVGPDVLLLHGLERTLLDMERLAARLTTHFHVVAMDFRNHGGSGTGPWTWDAVLSDIGAVIKAERLQRPSLVGHSLGGMIAALYAGLPGCTSAAVNLDGLGLGKPDQYVGYSAGQVWRRWRLLDLLAWPATRDHSFDERDADQVRAKKLAVISGWGHDSASADAVWERVVATRGDGRQHVRPTGREVQAIMRALGELNMIEVYRSCASPLLIFDCDDPLEELPAWVRRFIGALRRGVRRDYDALIREGRDVQVIRRPARHASMMLEQTAELAELVTDFLLR